MRRGFGAGSAFSVLFAFFYQNSTVSRVYLSQALRRCEQAGLGRSDMWTDAASYFAMFLFS